VRLQALRPDVLDHARPLAELRQAMSPLDLYAHGPELFNPLRQFPGREVREPHPFARRELVRLRIAETRRLHLTRDVVPARFDEARPECLA
jgi:hypothetical protein